MSDRTEVVHLEGGLAEMPAVIARAFTSVAGSRPSTVVLVFPSEVRMGASLASALGQAANGLDSLRELVLVHPGASVGFLASSLGLRLPRCRVRAERDLAAVDDRRASAPPRTSDPAFGASGGGRVGGSPAEEIDLRHLPFDRALVSAASTLRVRGSQRAVLLLDPAASPPPGLADVLVREMSQCVRLRELVLVHPSAVLGFIVSSAGLRLPSVRLEARREAASAERSA